MLRGLELRPEFEGLENIFLIDAASEEYDQ